MTLPRRCAVLVVGAGPTGLALAIRLRQQGVDCLLVDRDPAPHPWSRALGVQPRTLEILDALGVLNAVRQRSRQILSMHLHNARGPLMELDLTGLDAAWPWVLSCPQADLEACLAERYAELGGQLVRGISLDTFRQDGGEVIARLQTESGEHLLECELLVACDGANSVVREQLGVSFDGLDHRDHFLLADVGIDWPLTPQAAHVFLLPEGALFALPLPHGWRMVMNLPAADDDDSEAPTMAPFRDRLASVFGTSPAMTEPYWLSRFSIHKRLAGRYRVNRVLLAGDACHVQSPVGAQGMNTGIADAFNLAWKIGLFLQDVGGGRLLDSYEIERRPVARAMLTGVELLSRSSFTRNALLRGARDSLLRLAGRQPRFASRFLRRISQLDVHYPDSPLVAAGSGLFASLSGQDKGPQPGDRMPDATLWEVSSDESLRVQEVLREVQHYLFVQLSAEFTHLEVVAAFALADRVPGAFSRHVRVLVVVPDGVPDTLQEISEFDVSLVSDRDGSFRERFGDQGGLWLMRPDGHLGYRADISDSDLLLTYLRNLFARQH